MSRNLVHQLLALEFTGALGTFDAMHCIVVLSSCQRVTVEAEELTTNLIHRVLGSEFAKALGTFYRAVGHIVMLTDNISAWLRNQRDERT